MMRLDQARAHIGDKVIYQPPGQGPEAVEEGVITSINDSYVFVRYGAQVGSAATRPEDLTALGCGRPDLDKLLRAVLDALTSAGAWRDDAQVAQLLTVKRYGDRPGATVYVRELSGPGPSDWRAWTPGGET